MSLQRHPPFSIISKPISLQNHSQRIAFILKFPILVPIPKVVEIYAFYVISMRFHVKYMRFYVKLVPRYQTKIRSCSCRSRRGFFFLPKVRSCSCRSRRGFFFLPKVSFGLSQTILFPTPPDPADPEDLAEMVPEPAL